MVLENGCFVSTPAPASATVVLGGNLVQNNGGGGGMAQANTSGGRRSPVPPSMQRSLSPVPMPQSASLQPLQVPPSGVFGASPSGTPSEATIVHGVVAALPAAAVLSAGAPQLGAGDSLLPGGRRRWGPTVGKLCFVPVGTINLLGSGTVRGLGWVSTTTRNITERKKNSSNHNRLHRRWI
jgi:hypothetical protein